MPHRLLTLLHLCDSLFPTGAFAHSDGLEAATSAGSVVTAADLAEWMTVCLDETLGHLEGPAVLLAWEAFTRRHWDGQVATLPVAFGIVCACAGIARRAAAEGFMYTRLAATASGAMRLMSIGQHEAHALLSATLARVPRVVDDLIARRAPPAAFTPALDIALMEQQYVGSRLFLS
jgi:urease accessory protein UreF